MTWRGTATVSDRIFASLVYLLPLLDVVGFVGRILVVTNSFLKPIVLIIAAPIQPLLAIYTGFIPLIVFFALFLLVVRNESISHFIRFNAMQSILFSIVLSLVSIIWQFALAPIFGDGLLAQTLFNAVFLGTIAAVGYSIIQTALGRYAEIPTISEAVYTQVR
jgi:uncharacterized membrane protein